jgi:hypothetical protein
VEGVKIRRQTGPVEILVCCFFFAAIVCEPSSACSYSSNPTKVGRNFSALVLHQNEPLSGLQIELSTDPKESGDSRPVLTITTNESGLSEFTSIKPGPYYISIKHVAFVQQIEIVVDSRRTKARAEKIAFEWPGETPLSARSISGLLNAVVQTGSPLNDQAHPAFGPFAGATLTLMHAVSGEVIESQTASESGAFGFQWVPAGLYMLQVRKEENASSRYRVEDGYVPIEVDPSANASTINLYLYQGMCGSLGYENRQGTAAQ